MSVPTLDEIYGKPQQKKVPTLEEFIKPKQQPVQPIQQVKTFPQLQPKITPKHQIEMVTNPFNTPKIKSIGASRSFDKPNVGERFLSGLRGATNLPFAEMAKAVDTTTEKVFNSAVDKVKKAKEIQNILDTNKNLTKKERLELFKQHKATIFDLALNAMVGGKKLDYSNNGTNQMIQSAKNDLDTASIGLPKPAKLVVDSITGVIPTAINLGAAYVTGGAVNPLLLAGLQGGGQSAYQAQKEGATTNQQFYSGLLGGGIEALTEKIPLDNLRNILGKQGKKGVVNYIKNIAVQSGIEYPSEFISQFAQTVADENIYKHDIGKNKTLSDFIKETAKDSNIAGLQGAIGGGLLGGGASAINRFSNRTVKPPAKPQLPDLTKTKPQPQLIPYNTPKTTPNLPFNTAGNINARPIVENAVQGKNEGLPLKVNSDNVLSLYQQARPLENKVNFVVKNNPLTKIDSVQVDRLLKGEIALDEVSKNANFEAVKSVYEAKKAVQDVMGGIKQFNAQRKETLRNLAGKYLADVNSDNAKEKMTGIQYSLEHADRNFRDTFGATPQTEAMIDEYLFPIHTAEAQKNDLIKRFNAQSNQKLNKQERAYAQMYGELEFYKSQRNTEHYKNLINELEPVANKFYFENRSKINMENVKSEISVFRKNYDSLLDMMNKTLVANGYKPIQKRQGYFYHYQKNAPDTVLDSVAKSVGISMPVTELPTDIAGRTQNFKPGKVFTNFDKARTSNKTNYDIYEGFDKYINLAADVIYQTENIQKLRALTNEIRYKHSDEQTRERIDEIRNDENIAEEDRQHRLDEILKKPSGKLSGFVNDLEEYTNLLANKQSRLDRNFEQDYKRRVLNTSTNFFNRVAGNMVAGNIVSAVNNVVALTQGYGGVSTPSFLNALKDSTLIRSKDGFNEKSSFITNRFGHERLAKTTTEKVGNVLSTPFTIIDDLTVTTLVRARYYDNMKKGMTEAEAIKNADKFGAAVVGDRSKGGMPTRFAAKSPYVRAFTMFNYEFNNQYRYLLKDLPRESKERGQSLLLAVAKYLFASYVFNLFKKKELGGGTVGFDPIGLAQEAFGDYKTLSNKQATSNLTQNAAEQIPFVGGLLGGGKLPIQAAIPNFKTMFNTLTGNADKKKKTYATLKELSKPLYYALPPFAGGQIKKVVEGIGSVNKKGSYSVNSKGQDILQYPLPENAGAYTRAVLLGKSSFPEANDWVKGGFKSLSGTNTELYKTLTNEGYKGAYSYILDLNEAKKGSGGTDRVRNMLFENEDLTPFQKSSIDRKLTSQSSNINYSNRDTFELSQLSDRKRYAYNTLKEKLSLSVSAYTTYLNMLDGATKQDDILLKLRRLGMSPQEAYQFWEAVYGK